MSLRFSIARPAQIVTVAIQLYKDDDDDMQAANITAILLKLVGN